MGILSPKLSILFFMLLHFLQKMNRSELERELSLLSDTLNFIDNFTEHHNVDLKSWDAFNYQHKVPDQDSQKLSNENHSTIIFKGMRKAIIFCLVIFLWKQKN